MQEKESPEVQRIIDACRSLQADAVALELEDHTIVVAMNAYDGNYVVTCCDPCENLPSVARGLQIRLYSESSGQGLATNLPAATVRSFLFQWERQIALIFGRHYASRLVYGAPGTMALGEMTGNDLEAVRRRLMVAIGGCIELKAEK